MTNPDTPLEGQVIGFIGVGKMGEAMVRRLMAAGADAVVFDTDAAACRRLEAAGARAAPSARAVADEAAQVFACLPTPAASLAIATGSEGVMGGRRIRVLVECSTIGRAHIRTIADSLAEVGIALVDAPVSGGPAGAQAGTLATVVSGPEEAKRSVRAALSCWASAIVDAGPRAGASQVYKLVNQALTFANMVLAAEALAAGVKAGAEPRALLDFINASTGRSWATTEKFPRSVLTGQTGNGSLGIVMKDMQLYLDMCRETGTPSMLGAPAFAAIQMAEKLFAPSADLGSVATLFERLAETRFAPEG